MLFKKLIMIGSSIALVSFAHLTWNIDVICYTFFGFFPVGTAGYVAWPQTSWIEIITSTLHHIWYIPLTFMIIVKNGGIAKYSLRLSILYTLILVIFCRLFTPEEADGVYLNVNMAHRFWKYIPADILHSFNPPHYPFVIYLAWILVLVNIVNGLCFLLIKQVCYFWEAQLAKHSLKKSH